jgi:hypothetical protein
MTQRVARVAAHWGNRDMLAAWHSDEDLDLLDRTAVAIVQE